MQSNVYYTISHEHADCCKQIELQITHEKEITIGGYRVLRVYLSKVT